jgi:hypothetical protein
MLALALVLAACTVTLEKGVCQKPSGEWFVCVKLIIKKAAVAEPIDANTLYETREVDPSVYAPDPNATATSTVTVTLTSGATVSYATNLYYDSSMALSPVTPGYKVLVYRPVNPASLQSFIKQYQSQTAEFSTDSTIPLKDISGGNTASSPVDVRGRYNTRLEYIGTVNTEPPSWDRDPIEM